MTNNLERLRRRLTAWYAVTLGTIVVVLGTGLFIAIRAQISSQLDASLVTATDAIQRATSIREAEKTSASGAVMDAVGELRIPDRDLYLFNSSAQPLVPATAPTEITDAAMRALRDSMTLFTLYPANDHVLRVYGKRFRSRSHGVYVAVAVADQLELEDQYAALIVAFGAAALFALVLFAAGGYFLTRKSIEPVERTMSYMRRFMADAAHELRTPLAVVRSRAEVALAAEPDTGRQREALAAIEREAIRLGKIVEDLLLLARSDAGGWPVAMKRIFLDDVVSDAVSAASALAARGNVTLAIDRFEEAPIDGDEALIRQLVMIILDNAVKFTPSGGSVLVSVINGSQGPVLSVTDSGIGIPADQLSHVFERFYRGDAARARGDGAGLGLSIAQWIADTHNARIGLRSENGQGTVAEVRFSLPAKL
ncbi:MAG TPA: HAMP domain-containing sensor histidine kinase [Gemmatimonadaceae bacterium]